MERGGEAPLGPGEARGQISKDRQKGKSLSQVSPTTVGGRMLPPLHLPCESPLPAGLGLG